MTNDSTVPAITITPKEKLAAAIAALGLSISAEFVPWSKSRNKGEKQPSLNWKVTLIRTQTAPAFASSTPVLTCDYMAGSAHCPAYKKQPRHPSGQPDKWMKDRIIAWECENGMQAYFMPNMNHIGPASPRKKIMPEIEAVIHSLVMDSDVLNYPTFESWALEFGFDPDSRKAESIYKACLDIGLKLKAAIGDAGIEALREAGQDY